MRDRARASGPAGRAGARTGRSRTVTTGVATRDATSEARRTSTPGLYVYDRRRIHTTSTTHHTPHTRHRTHDTKPGVPTLPTGIHQPQPHTSEVHRSLSSPLWPSRHSGRRVTPAPLAVTPAVESNCHLRPSHLRPSHLRSTPICSSSHSSVRVSGSSRVKWRATLKVSARLTTGRV